MQILYFNGLGTGETRRFEAGAIDYLESRGHQLTHGHVNWREKIPYSKLLREKELQARRMLTNGKLAIVGSSAGESLAYNVLDALPNKTGAYAIGLCGRIRPGPVAWWDWRDLSTMAHLGTDTESTLFYNSVVECERTLDQMDDATLSHITKVYQLADFVVPRTTMLDPRINSVRINTIGHGMGIAMAIARLPHILDQLESGGSERPTSSAG